MGLPAFPCVPVRARARAPFIIAIFFFFFFAMQMKAPCRQRLRRSCYLSEAFRGRQLEELQLFNIHVMPRKAQEQF